MGELPLAPEWEAVIAGELGGPAGAVDRAAIELRAQRFGLQRLVWPSPWPPDTRTATLAATYAKRIGRGVAFSLAAFRQAFAGGRDLGDPDTSVIAGAACEMHPTALLKGIGMRSVSEALATAHARARGLGVVALPAVVVAGRAFTGPDCVELAARRLGNLQNAG